MSAGDWGWCAAVVVALAWAGREIERASVWRRTPVGLKWTPFAPITSPEDAIEAMARIDQLMDGVDWVPTHLVFQRPWPCDCKRAPGPGEQCTRDRDTDGADWVQP